MKTPQMRSRVRLFIALIISFLATACSTVTHTDSIGAPQASLDETCKVEIFTKLAMPQQYEVIGKIETHIKRNIFFGGSVRTEDEGYQELRVKACKLGGNAVVIDDSIETSSAEMRHVHIWARVLKKSI
jgi:hypothetical protein